MTFEPVDDPPAPGGNRGRWQPLREWLKANPGQWAKVTTNSTATFQTWRAKGFEVTTRGRTPNAVDHYLRWPEK